MTLVFQSAIGETPGLRPLCEERVVLFRAPNDAAARAAALRYAKLEAHSYRNVYGQEVEWRFAAIDKTEALEAPADGDGWEVASRFVRKSLRTLRKASQV